MKANIRSVFNGKKVEVDLPEDCSLVVIGVDGMNVSYRIPIAFSWPLYFNELTLSTKETELGFERAREAILDELARQAQDEFHGYPI